MKKIIALILAFMLISCIVACDNGSAGDSKETTTPSGNEGNPDGTTGGGDGSQPVDDVTTSGSGENVKIPVLQDAVAVNETVYLTVDGAHYRSLPVSLDNNLVGSLKWGDSVVRVAYNNEWSAIVINETEYYLPTECLSATKPEGDSDFVPMYDTVLSGESDAVLRTAPIASGLTEQVYLDEGVSLRRVRRNQKWSVVEYEGVELYIEVDLHSDPQKSEEEINFDTYEGTLVVTAESANLYGVPSNDEVLAEIEGTVRKGEKLTAHFVSTDGTWYCVSAVDAATGMTQKVYIKAADVKAAEA